MGVSRALGLTVTAGLLCGCSLTSGNISPFSSTSPAVAVAPPPAPQPVAYGAFLDGPVGSKLSPTTRDKALAAEQDALASGQRKGWKGDNGTFGYVEPTPGASVPKPTADAEASPPSVGSAQACRSFTSTVFIAGRPQVGHGSGCQNPDGTYRITG